MKEENYETICGRKNSNHAILDENIIRQMFPSQFENDIMGINKERIRWFPEIYYFISTVLSHVSQYDVLCRNISIC